MKPQDIEREPWTWLPSESWSNVAFRAVVLAFVKDYTKSRNWAASWDVTERFTDTGINVKVQRGRVSLYDNTPPEEFKQRDGIRILVIGVTRVAKVTFGGEKRFEVGLSFPEGITTPTSDINLLLSRAADTLDAQYRKDRGL